MLRRPFPTLCLLLGLGLHPFAAAGQEAANTSQTFGPGAATSTPVTLHRITGEIRLDGVVDETAWDEVEPLPMTMFSPTFGGQTTERTEVRIAHDDEYLYVSGRMFDSDPSGIRTNTLYRDLYSGDDLLAVVIDSYNDYETAVWFVTNPAGARNDRTVSNDADFGAGMPMNSDWNSHWDVATTQTDEGWFAEFRIPFSTLGFQAPAGRATMGLISYRFIARKNERQTFPSIDPRWGGLAFAKPSLGQRIELGGVVPSKPLYVTPYMLGGVAQIPQLQEPPDVPQAAWQVDDDFTREVGFDLKFSPTSNLALDLTLNTDFAQVEADDQQINLTRFALFFPEKRQFFQERSSTFDFNTGGFVNRLFHSRQIGLDKGDLVRIYGGTRAVGRAGGMDFGLLTMQTAEHDGRSGENMGVLRLSQQVLNPFSSVGGMVTTRLGGNGEDNIGVGLDSSIRLTGDEYVTVKWAQTFDEAVEEESVFESGVLFAQWQRRRDDGFAYSGEYTRVGADYLPRLGFQTRKDFSFYGASLQYKSFRDADSRLRSVGGSVETGHFYRNGDGSAESRGISPGMEFEFKGGTELRFGTISSYESVADSFSISDLFITPGDYWFHEVEANLMLPRSLLFRGDFGGSIGRFYDGTRTSLRLNPAWNQSKHLELGAGYEVNRLDFPDRGVATTAHLARLRVQVALNTRVQMSTFAQYNSANDLASFNARFRYHFREGTDLWLVYNEGVNTLLDNGLNPRLTRSAGRSFLIKYSHALIF